MGAGRPLHICRFRTSLQPSHLISSSPTDRPQATTPAPFKLSCDERAQSDYTRSSDAFKLTREEREAAEVGRGDVSVVLPLNGFLGL